MYERELKQVLVGRDLYGGDVNYADLRFTYKGILDSIRQIGVVEDETQYVIQLTEVHEEYVKKMATEFLSHKTDVGEYSKEEIIGTVCKFIPTINAYLLQDVQDIIDACKMMNKEPVFFNKLASSRELMQKGLLN